MHQNGLAAVRGPTRLLDDDWPRPGFQAAFHNVNSWEKLCSNYALRLCKLADAVGARFPKLFPDLRLVGCYERWHDVRDFDWDAAEVELRRIEAAALAARAEGRETVPAGEPSKPQRRRRKRPPMIEKPLTDKQVEAVQIVGECSGNLSEAARRLATDRSALTQRYRAALRKMGKAVVKHATKRLPTDRRGQATVGERDDSRL
jgi:hypothetical protein